MERSYLPHNESEREAMQTEIGVAAIDDLFSPIPADIRLNRPLKLPAPGSESELVKDFTALAARNADSRDYTCFLGAGAYDHFIPGVVGYVTGRSEFSTAYTQYQPEVSQGYLQALWEYQSMICELTGMPVANASLYDGGTALAEAMMLACGVKSRSRVVVSRTVHPHYRTIMKTYGRDRGYDIAETAYKEGTSELEALAAAVTKEVAAVVVQSPNFFGCIEDLAAIAAIAHQNGALLITAVDPISLGLLEAPGVLGADIVVGEGQALGLPLNFGGPYLGFFATTEKLMRKMPGRVIGQTVDCHGARGFVLTLQTREQHIRREKATSNICSNEALCALAAAVYLTAVGKNGLRQVAELCLQKANYAGRKLAKLAGYQLVFAAPFFKEFLLRCPRPVAEINAGLRKNKIIGGLDVGRFYPELNDCLLICVTEQRTREEIDRLAAGLEAMA